MPNPALPSLPVPRRRAPGLRVCLARLCMLAPLVAGSAQAATSYVVSYFSLPGMAYTTLFDIDNEGRLLAWGLADLESTYGGYLVDQGVAQAYRAPNGETALVRSFSQAGLIVGSHADPSRTYTQIQYVFDPVNQTQVEVPVTVPVTVGFVAGPGGAWQQIETPVQGVQTTTVSSISPDGRYLTGLYSPVSTGFVGQYRHDRQTGDFSLIPASVGLFNVYAVNNNGVIFGSSSRTPRQAVVYDPSTAQRTVLPTLGYTSRLARAVNASGLMAGSLSTGQSWVGTADSMTVLDTKPGFATATGINDLGQVVGGWDSEDGSQSAGFIATPVQLPLAGGAPGEFSFSIDVVADQPVFIDPVVAVGYTYATGTGDPLFKTVSLPLGIGDSRYTLSVGGQTLDIGGNQIVDFTALGFADGVAGFTVTGIETSAMLDPTDASAFVTRLTFMASGRFTGTQTALTVDVPAVPEPGTVALWLLGLAGLAVAARPQNRRHGQRQHPGQHPVTREVRPAAGDGEARPAA